VKASADEVPHIARVALDNRKVDLFRRAERHRAPLLGGGERRRVPEYGQRAWGASDREDTGLVAVAGCALSAER
jgi:hypothetical protein